MEIPRKLREQIKFYERHGFHVVDMEYREGSHVKVIFAEFPGPQFLTNNVNEPRGWKNNISRYKRLAQKAKEKLKEKNHD